MLSDCDNSESVSVMNKYTVPSGYFGNIWARLSEQVSDTPCPSVVEISHPAQKAFVEFLCQREAAEGERKVRMPKIVLTSGDGFLNQDYPAHKLVKGDKRVLLGYSGGKDSIYSATKLRKAGYEVEACFVTGLNRSSRDEKQAAIDTCKLLNIPLHIIPVKTSGSSNRFENPAKNILVLALMLDIGGPIGIPNYSLGTEGDLEGGIEDYFTSTDFSDSPDVLELGCATFKPLKNYRFINSNVPLWSYESYKAVLNRPKGGMELMAALRSCMSQYQYRAKLHSVNESKYGVKLLPGRCGSCWKCCLEYLYLEAMGRVVPNKAYSDHCWRRLKKHDATATPEWLRMMTAKLSKIANGDL